ncbi:MAG TPA: hypothetical protein PLN94_06000, partial [Thiolinea sp.]|nr:hypothetical protein [Thiolinea sp.]
MTKKDRYRIEEAAARLNELLGENFGVVGVARLVDDGRLKPVINTLKLCGHNLATMEYFMVDGREHRIANGSLKVYGLIFDEAGIQEYVRWRYGVADGGEDGREGNDEGSEHFLIHKSPTYCKLSHFYR